MASVCPVVGTTTTVLPPDHPQFNPNDTEARCPVTNAKVSHHKDSIHSHPSSPTIPDDNSKRDATLCPAMKSAGAKEDVVEATCPVVGTVSATLPPDHPKLTNDEAGSVCPVTNATLDHHKDKVHQHPSVPSGSPVSQCPVAGSMLK